MKYILMCGGDYLFWSYPKQLTELTNDERILDRTIRLLHENSVEDIAISSNNSAFEEFGLPVLQHDNEYRTRGYDNWTGSWVNAFYPMDEPACYIFGDVIFSPEAIKKIITTPTDDIELFASAPPFTPQFPKASAEPFALKVVNQPHLRHSIALCKYLADLHLFKRKPIMWELWQVIKQTPLNFIDYTNYTVINDYTCDIDGSEDIQKIRRVLT